MKNYGVVELYSQNIFLRSINNSLGKFLNPYTGIWQNEKDDAIVGTVSIDGLKDEVIVHYDAQLIPHVFAKNDI